MLFHFQKIFKAILFLPLAACLGNNGVTTLDTLTVSSSNDGEYAKLLSANYPLQSRFLAVNGQLPVPSVGTPCLASSFRPANSIICLSPNGNSHILSKYYKSEATLTELTAIKKKLSTLELDIISLIQQGDTKDPDKLADLEESVQVAAKAVENLINKNNIFVFRWSSSAGGSGAGNVGSVFSGRASGKQNQSGLVIVSGLYIEQLMVGVSDFTEAFKDSPEASKIATLTMSAENVLYFSSQDLSAALQGSANTTLEKGLKGLPDSTKVAVEAYLAIGSARENQGVFKNPTVVEKTLAESYADAQTKQVIYATMTDVETLIESLNARP